MSTSDVTAQTASQQRVVARDFPHSETSEVSVRVHPDIGNTGSSTNEIEMRKSVLSLQATVSKLTEILEDFIQRTSTTQAFNNSGSLEGRTVNIRTNNIPEPDSSPIVQLEEGTLFGNNSHCASYNNNNNQSNTIEVERNNNANTRSTFGYAAESLPFVETVHPSIKRQIQEGNDVNLATLLIPYYSAQETV